MSKLQALAAARKKKTQDQKSSPSIGVEKPMASLSLSGKGESVAEKPHVPKPNPRGFPLRKRKDSNPHEKIPAPSIDQECEPTPSNKATENPPLDQAEPSAFANTMFSNTPGASHHQHPTNFFSLPYAAAAMTTQHDPFAGPSPDDVVIAAQSKGSTTSVRPQK
jgi:elongation factor 1 alpha-like protein